MAGRRRGFSLIELLVVIIIIALVVAIVVPALGGARNAARSASTQSLMNQVVGASAAFETDHHKLPGYFSPRQMGMQSNETQGFTGGENVMLDLAGGVVGTSPPSGNTEIQVGPGTGAPNQVTVDLQKIGVGDKVYLVPPEKFYKVQPPGGQITEQTGSGTGTNGTDDQLPDLVDAWDAPLLIWVKDESAIRPIDPQNDSYLCSRNSLTGATMANSARYYWASNAGILKATAVGKKQMDQTWDTNRACSLIGDGAPGIIAPGAPSLEAVLGSPNFPYHPGASMTPQNAEFNAADGRGAMIIHSAGRDGLFVGSNERGGINYTTRGGTPGSGVLFYGWSQQNLATNPPSPHVGKDGKNTNIDIIKDFDDLISTGSN